MSEPNPAESQPSFEAALAELQQIVADLEDGQLGLEPSLTRFEQGIRLLRNCHRILEQAEQKIDLLVRLEPEGGEVTIPFEASATFEAESPQKKTSRRKSAKPEVSPSDIRDQTAEIPPSPDNGDPSLF